jgi:hypothetical protein
MSSFENGTSEQAEHVSKKARTEPSCQMTQLSLVRILFYLILIPLTSLFASLDD